MSLSMLPEVLGSCFCSPCNYLLNGDERCKCCVYHLLGKRSGDPRAFKFPVNEEPFPVRNENFVEFDDIMLPKLDKLYPWTAASETLPSLRSRNAELGFDRKVSISHSQVPSNLPPNEVIKAKENMNQSNPYFLTLLLQEITQRLRTRRPSLEEM